MDWSLGTGRVPKPFTPLPSADLLAALDGPEPFVLFETSRVTDSEQRSFLFTDPVGVVTASRPDEMENCLAALQEALDRGLWAAGYLSYEAGSCFEPSLRVRHSRRFPLLWFALFRRPVLFDHRTGLFSSSLPFALGEDGPRRDFSITDLRLNVTREGYRRAVESIRERIAAGDTYQVNFTMKYRFGFEGSTAGLYLCLRDNQPVPYGAFLRTGGRDILSSSPELFFSLRKGEITARPMKGTAPRGRNGEEDLRRSIALATDGKNRAENIMIVDLLRNDLGRLCRPGSIEVADLCRVEPYDTLFQMTSTVRGRLRGGPLPAAS